MWLLNNIDKLWYKSTTLFTVLLYIEIYCNYVLNSAAFREINCAIQGNFFLNQDLSLCSFEQYMIFLKKSTAILLLHIETHNNKTLKSAGILNYKDSILKQVNCSIQDIALFWNFFALNNEAFRQYGYILQTNQRQCIHLYWSLTSSDFYQSGFWARWT